MRRVYRPLLVMHPSEAFRERVRRASGNEYHFQSFPDWESLRGAVRSSPPAALVVVYPYEGANGRSGNGAETRLSDQLQAMLAEFPSMAVLAAMRVVPEASQDLHQLGRWGVVQVISEEHDDTPSAIAMRLKSARGRPMRALLDQALPPETPGRARAIVEAATDIVMTGQHGRDLAEQLDLSRRTLLRWCRRAGLPPPRRLLAWMRILLAAELLDDPGRTVLDVAHTCGYSSDSGLRRVTQKFLGASPSELREQGAFARAAETFIEEVREARRKNK